MTSAFAWSRPMPLRAPARSRAAVLAGPARVQLERCDAGTPGAGQVRVRIEGCGVCASNLPLWEGRPWFHYPQAPGVPGHEAWGVVEAVGADVRAPRPGERVALLAEDAFRETVVTDVGRLALLPAALRGRDLPAEALGCAVNVFHRARIAPGQQVAILGAGFLGLLLVQLCRAAGARVAVTSRRPLPLVLARRFGAEEAFHLCAPEEIEERLVAWTQGRLCPRVIEATGHAEPLALAGRLCAFGGRLVIAGFHQDGPREVDLQLWNWRGIDVVNAHERDREVRLRGVREAVAAVAEGRLDPEPLITHRLPFERLDEAFDLAARRPPDFLKALVLMGSGGSGAA